MSNSHHGTCTIFELGYFGHNVISLLKKILRRMTFRSRTMLQRQSQIAAPFVAFLFFLYWFIETASGLAATSPLLPVMFDSCNGHHRDLQYHPEQPERIVACVKALDKARNERGTPLELIDIAPAPEAIHSEGGKHAIITTTHRPFSREELEYAREILLETHEKSLVTKLEEKSEKSRRLRIDAGKSPLGHMGYIDFDTYLTTETFNVCLRATAAWIRATNIAMGKESSSTGSSAAIALTRPPGHHATFDNSNGFCHFNFAAAAAVHVMRQYPNSRVSILDWDVHYGQGVADIIRRHDRARFVSIHQTPAFPYQGEKFGIQGQHTNVFTIPMPAETSWSKYKIVFREMIKTENMIFSSNNSSYLRSMRL